jgi:tetratricopeptide (TPR) repeat protein
LQNISIYTEYVKTNNFKDAYQPWKAVFTEAPLAQMTTYINGAKILRALIATEKDGAKQKQYLEELLKVHDQRIQYLDGLNKLVKSKVSKGDILAAKAHDFYSFMALNPDVNTLYTIFKEAVDLEKQNLPYYVMQEFADVSGQKIKSDAAHKEQFIQDYITIAGYANDAYKAATKEKAKEQYKMAKDNIDAHFINSGVATCEKLQEIYAPKVEENKANLDYLKSVITVMQKLGCREAEAYFAASEYAHAIEPTAATAFGCGAMYYKKGDIEKSVQYFDNAIELEEDLIQKADYCFTVAQILFGNKQLSKARQYARKSIEYNGANGKPYILIAQMYATSPNWSDEPALNKCTYFAVIDKLQKAKSVDPSIAEEADKHIRTYAGYTPKDEDLFFIGLKKGNAVTIGGWIGETTTIR